MISKLESFGIQFLLLAYARSETFDRAAQGTSNSQLQLDTSALLIGYNTDFQKKVSPGLYLSRASNSILELFNSAEYSLSNAEQVSKYSFAAYLCFTEPSTDGCEHFNELGCESITTDCQAASTKQESNLASMCTRLVQGKKEVLDDCFIVSLRQSADGLSADQVAPWNEEMQDWVDGHNCTALMYHLKYRCHATLIKWDAVTASEQLVDLDKLFDSAFGMTSISNYNGGDPTECSSLTDNDRQTLKDVAKLHVEAAVLTFASTAISLARFGVSSADVMFRQSFTPQLHLQDKLRTTLLLNLFYDGAVQPFREACCAANMCYDYHPMDVLVDKVSAFNTFYPGGLLSLSAMASEFSGVQDVGKTHASTGLPITNADAYVYSVLRNAPARASWEAATGATITNIEAF